MVTQCVCNLVTDCDKCPIRYGGPVSVAGHCHGLGQRLLHGISGHGLRICLGFNVDNTIGLHYTVRFEHGLGLYCERIGLTDYEP